MAYSRVHTGVHYPGDAIAGALVGAAAGQSVARALDRRHRRRRGLRPAACPWLNRSGANWSTLFTTLRISGHLTTTTDY